MKKRSGVSAKADASGRGHHDEIKIPSLRVSKAHVPEWGNVSGSWRYAKTKIFPFGIAPRGSFKRQIILTFGVGFFFLIAAFTVYLVKSESDYLYRDSREDTISLAQSLAASSLSWVLANDVVGLQEVVNSFQSHPELRYAMILSPSGLVLAHSDATKVGQYVSDEQSLLLIQAPPVNHVMLENAAIMDVAVPIMSHERYVGWARVAQARKRENDNLRQMALGNAFFVLFSTALSLLAALFIANRLGYRIGSLVKVAKEVQSGNFSTRANIAGPEDEISILAASLNHMLDALAQNEKELRMVSVYTRSLIEASLDPLVTISREGKITDVNKTTEEVTGRSRAELIGTDFSDYFTEPDKAREGYQQVFRKSFVTDYPLAIRHRDGHITDVLYNANVYRDEAGNVLGVFAAARDITERKHAEEVLRQSEEALKEAQRIAHLGSWHMDLATNEVYWSEELYRMYGFDPALPPPLYTESMKLFTPESWERLSTAIARATETGIPYELELELVSKGGGTGWMQARGELVRDAQGKAVRIRGVVMDITERKYAEIALREKEERLTLATLQNGVGVWDWNLQTQEMIWDDSMYALYHIRREDFSGTEEAWRAALHPDDLERGDREVADAIAGKKPFETEFRVIWPNGEIHHIKAVAKVFRDEQGTPLRMLGINMDITDRKRAEEEIHQLNAELERRVVERTAQLEAANKELEAFSYSVSHDLRTPLRAIDGFSHILLDDYANRLDDEAKRLLNVVRDNTNKMSQLIDDILKFSRAGRTEMAFLEIDMEGMAREVYEELLPSAGEHEMKVEIGHIPPAKGDRAMMRQVLVNLLSNAIKFSRTKTPAMIKVGATAAGNETIYFVQDNGAGFDMQYADRLFGVFQRLHATTEFEGTGIGLAIVKRIITRHGGRVWAEGKINEGATIYFALPVREGGA